MPETQPSPAVLTGVLRLTWLHDDLRHVLDHSDIDEPAGTWTGLAGPGHGLAVGSDTDIAVLQRLCAGGDVADLIWEAPPDLAAAHESSFDAAMSAHQSGDKRSAEQHWYQLQVIWSRAWTANCQALELMQQAGIARFGSGKPQRWVIASFEHHCGPHGVQHPHVHNIVITRLTEIEPATADAI